MKIGIVAKIVYFPPVLKVLAYFRHVFQMSLLRFYKDPGVMQTIELAYRRADLQMQPFDVYSLYTLAKMQSGMPGDMAEIGMYKGGSAMVICSVKSDKTLYGFDTFEGLPDVGSMDTHYGAKWFRKNQYAAGIDSVRANVQGFDKVELVQGLFPGSGVVLESKKLCFVHIDTDLYESTFESLKYLWGRVVDKGIVLVHDTNAAGVRRALDEFLKSRDDVSWFECGCTQVALIKKSGNES